MLESDEFGVTDNKCRKYKYSLQKELKCITCDTILHECLKILNFNFLSKKKF